MQLNITEDDLVGNIQSAFHQQYPWLKLEFYKNPHEPGTISPKAERLGAAVPIEDIRMFHSAGPINIHPGRKVWELEHEFLVRFGLCVQVFHRSGDLWLETTATDHTSLELLNEKAKASCTPIPREEPGDYSLEDVS